jgi:hypothetical protein
VCTPKNLGAKGVVMWYISLRKRWVAELEEAAKTAVFD